MTWTIHHVNVPSSNVRREAAFFRTIVGLTDGTWTYPPEVGDLHHDEDGIAYFGLDNRGLHVVRLIPQFAKEQGFLHNPTVGGHIAINIDDVRGFMARCDAQAIPLSDAGTYAMAGIHQTYAFDPSGNLIEVNATVSPLPERNQSPRADVRITGIVLPAHEQETAERFFSDTVGLGEATERSPGQVDFRNGAQSLTLVRPDPDFPGSHNPTISGCFRLAVSGLDTIVGRLDDAGHAYSEIPEDRFTGKRVVYTFTPSARIFALEEPET